MVDEQTAASVAEDPITESRFLMDDVNSLICSMGFEPLPLEECRQRNEELWRTSPLGERRVCHGCGTECRAFGMIYFSHDYGREHQRAVEEWDFKRAMKIHSAGRCPEDGWYCSAKCYERNRDAK